MKSQKVIAWKSKRTEIVLLSPQGFTSSSPKFGRTYCITALFPYRRLDAAKSVYQCADVDVVKPVYHRAEAV